MRLLYFRDPNGNFGDDLNAVMWRELLPSHIFEDEDSILLGIGSIFNSDHATLARTSGKRVIVLGSGAGYASLPLGWKKWTILAVRGQLTAALIGRPDLAATDAAALLATLPRLSRVEERRSVILFIPHHHSMVHGNWKKVAERAGLTFVDPRGHPLKVLQAISKAKLVVAEAMHGAILADTLRVPWIPVITSPDILPFKWMDWASSLNVPYRPAVVSPSSFWERHHHKYLLRHSIKTSEHVQAGIVPPEYSLEELLAEFKNVYGEPREKLKGGSAPGPSRRGLRQHFRPAIQALGSSTNPYFVERAVKQLAKIATGTGYLSDDTLFRAKVQQLQQALGQLVQLCR